MDPKKVLQSLYPQDVARLERGVASLLEKYDSIAPTTTPLSQRDVIMITYGDAIQDNLGSPLSALLRFAKEHLGDTVSAIHLLPCFPYTSDDGFSVQDYYEIDPALGDWSDIRNLGQSYELMFDAVVNHISQESSWFQGFLSGESQFEDYFLVADPNLDYSQVTRPRALPLLHPFQKGDETVHVWTTFSRDQVDLNYRSADVFLHVLDVLLFYVSRGARYIRLDAIAFIWKELGTYCIHQPEAHEIIQLYRHYIDSVAPQTVIITETNVPHEENVSYFGDGTDEAHMVYNFTLPPLLMHSLHAMDVGVLTEWAKSLRLPSDQVCFFNFTASHDGVGVRPLQGIVSNESVQALADIAVAHGGFVSMKDNGDGTQSPYEINCNYFDFATNPSRPDDERVQRFLLTQSVMLTMPGIPGVYYHSLLGSENDRQGAIESGINRRINREKLAADELVATLLNEESIRGKVFARYKKLLIARRAEPSFGPCIEATFRSEGRIFIVERGQGLTQIVAMHNFGDATETTDLQSPCIDVISGQRFECGPMKIGPYEFRWLKPAT